MLFIGLISLLCAAQSFSQSWCYPGASWYYTRNNAFSSGYSNLNYVYDTVIAGKNCNKITKFYQGNSTGGPFAVYGTSIFTYLNNNVVYIKDVTGATSNFDTLFNYGAAIGDKWSLAPSSWTTCSNSRVTVQDTGRSNIMGKWLKWFKVSIQSNIGTSMDTIYERIGCLVNYMLYPGDVCPKSYDTEDGGPLRCYSDNQIAGYRHNFSGNL